MPSALIRWVTRSRYSHVGLVFRYEERVYCLEAVGIGVRLILMSELVRRYHGGIDYFHVVDVDPEQRRKAVGFAFQQLGKQYDQRGLVRFLRFLLFGHRQRARDRGSWFCSELVNEAWRLQGVRLATLTSAYTAPEAIAVSAHVRFGFRVKR